VSIAALIAWVITVGFGSFMLARWVRHGGLRRAGGGSTHFAPARVFSHFLLALGGLIVWIAYLATSNAVLAWIAFADLVLVGLLGGLLVRRWAKDGRAAAGGRSPAVDVDLAEQHIPRAPVVLHGTFASITFILVLLSAVGIGRS
jgi:hypothetical protein